MDSRTNILDRLRRVGPAPCSAPSVPASRGVDDPVGEFASLVAEVGGVFQEVESEEGACEVIRSLSVYRAAESVFSELSGLSLGVVEPESRAHPRAAMGLDLAILRAEFGVVENGALWRDASTLDPRAVLFLAEHLILVFPLAELEPDLHAAYRRLDLSGCRIGYFLSGPSKTADIEQHLVIGAQGPRSLLVLGVSAARH